MATSYEKHYRWCCLAILLGFSLGNEVQMREMPALVESFVENVGDFPERHKIARRDAGSFQPSFSLVFHSTSSRSATTQSKSTTWWNQSAFSSMIVNHKSISTILPSNTVRKSVYSSPTAASSILATESTSVNKPTTPTTENLSKSTFTFGTTPFSSETYSKDRHRYYESHYFKNGLNWWFDLDNGSKKALLHEELAKNIKFSDSLLTSFHFPYYGHRINNVTITNKGYVFLGERVHKFNASAQYAAPLMADFGSHLHNKTVIRYVDTGDRFTVEWANMRLISEHTGKEFSFQCSILKNGTLVFAYKTIPLAVEDLKNDSFHVRVGVSDTYRREKLVRRPTLINGRIYSAVRYITYYLYDIVALEKSRVISGSAYVLVPELNCVIFKTCEQCLTVKTKFDCSWCPKLKRCSDGIDRHRAEWENAGCVVEKIRSCHGEKSSLNAGEIVVIVIVLLIVGIVIAWFVYAYSHPNTKSGMFLLQYGNPTKWCRNSSDTPNTSSDGGRISFKTMPFEGDA